MNILGPDERAALHFEALQLTHQLPCSDRALFMPRIVLYAVVLYAVVLSTFRHLVHVRHALQNWVNLVLVVPQCLVYDCLTSKRVKTRMYAGLCSQSSKCPLFLPPLAPNEAD